MGAKARRTDSRKTRTQRRRRRVRRIVYVLNLLLGVATHGCELAAFGSYWVAPSNLVAPDVRTERELGDMRPTNISRLLECPVPLTELPPQLPHLNVNRVAFSTKATTSYLGWWHRWDSNPEPADYLSEPLRDGL